jgi:hypothetical protein
MTLRPSKRDSAYNRARSCKPSLRLPQSRRLLARSLGASLPAAFTPLRVSRTMPSTRVTCTVCVAAAAVAGAAVVVAVVAAAVVVVVVVAGAAVVVAVVSDTLLACLLHFVPPHRHDYHCCCHCCQSCCLYHRVSLVDDYNVLLAHTNADTATDANGLLLPLPCSQTNLSIPSFLYSLMYMHTRLS